MKPLQVQLGLLLVGQRLPGDVVALLQPGQFGLARALHLFAAGLGSTLRHTKSCAGPGFGGNLAALAATHGHRSRQILVEHQRNLATAVVDAADGTVDVEPLQQLLGFCEGLRDVGCRDHVPVLQSHLLLAQFGGEYRTLGKLRADSKLVALHWSHALAQAVVQLGQPAAGRQQLHALLKIMDQIGGIGHLLAHVGELFALDLGTTLALLVRQFGQPFAVLAVAQHGHPQRLHHALGPEGFVAGGVLGVGELVRQVLDERCLRLVAVPEGLAQRQEEVVGALPQFGVDRGGTLGGVDHIALLLGQLRAEVANRLGMVEAVEGGRDEAGRGAARNALKPGKRVALHGVVVLVPLSTEGCLGDVERCFLKHVLHAFLPRRTPPLALEGLEATNEIDAGLLERGLVHHLGSVGNRPAYRQPAGHGRLGAQRLYERLKPRNEHAKPEPLGVVEVGHLLLHAIHVVAKALQVGHANRCEPGGPSGSSGAGGHGSTGGHGGATASQRCGSQLGRVHGRVVAE